MISIIICSRKQDISEELKQNILATIGVKYELIVIDNSKNKHSIFSAYNEGIHYSKYHFLCFMHDDILYHTNNWGEKVIDHFNNPKVGVIGVAGGHYFPNSPSPWASSNINTINILHSSFKNGIKKTDHLKQLSNLKDNSAEVVAVDGVWFCVRKTLFSTISFDEISFKGFHCYDLDICFQARSAGSKVLVISDVLLEHFSGGNWNKEWLENSIIFHNKWKEKLPQIVGVELTQEHIKLREEFEREKFMYLEDLIYYQSELNRIQLSKAYRIGKFILKPFVFFKKKYQLPELIKINKSVFK